MIIQTKKSKYWKPEKRQSEKRQYQLKFVLTRITVNILLWVLCFWLGAADGIVDGGEVVEIGDAGVGDEEAGEECVVAVLVGVGVGVGVPLGGVAVGVEVGVANTVVVGVVVEGVRVAGVEGL